MVSMVFFFFLSINTAFSQETGADLDFYSDLEFDAEDEEYIEADKKKAEKKKEDSWFAFGADRSFYGLSELSYGANFSFGYGTGTSIGLSTAWYINREGIDALEINILLRYYFLKPAPLMAAYHGPFVQVMAGPVIFYRTIDFSLPAKAGMLSAGINAGWRFVFADRAFIEASVKGGYPYMFGAAVTAGVRF